jgi:lauroyl/myristoyl acyltransferase
MSFQISSCKRHVVKSPWNNLDFLESPPNSHSRFGINLALTLGRLFPPRAGYRLASFLADRIANRHNWELVRAVRANQWMISHGKLSGQELDQTVREVFHNIARYQYELYHYLNDTQAMQRLFLYDSALQRLLERSEFEEQGLVVVGLHLGNFDLVLRACFNMGIQSHGIDHTRYDRRLPDAV